MVAEPEPQKKAKRSRKGKASWRKNIDIEDVEEGLAERRIEYIETGDIDMSAQPDEFLFTISRDSAYSRPRDKLLKPSKVDEILSRRSAVPAIGQKRPAKSVVDAVVKKQPTGLPFRERKEKSKAVLESERVAGELQDIWGAEVQPQQHEPISKAVDRSKQIALQAGSHQPPGVAPAASGYSYNPPAEEWAQMIRDAAKEEEAYQARIAGVLEGGSNPQKNTDFDNLADDDVEEEEEEEEENNQIMKVDLTTRPEYQPRNPEKEPEQLKAEEKAKQTRLSMAHLPKLNKDFENLHEILQEVVKEQQLQQRTIQRKQRIPQFTLKKTKREADSGRGPRLELQLSDELADSLRRVKTEGNLIWDRFKSLQERGVIELYTQSADREERKRARRNYSWQEKDRYYAKFNKEAVVPDRAR